MAGVQLKLLAKVDVFLLPTENNIKFSINFQSQQQILIFQHPDQVSGM